MNPGFAAFQTLKKHVADKLGIPNGKQAAQIGGIVLKKIKDANPSIDSVGASKKAMEELDNNIQKYKKML